MSERIVIGTECLVEVEGRRPPGRPKKTWRKVVEEDMRILNITVEMAMDRQQ